jgi:large subunit ribosomal protein L30
MAENKYIAVVKIRSKIDASDKIKFALDNLRLRNKLRCAVFLDNPSIRGQLRIVKDFTTFGTISEEFLGEMLKKRGEEFTTRDQDSKGKIKYGGFLTHDKKKFKSVLRLHPPVGGFERKGIKKPFNLGGALGDRKDKIKDLIVRML